MRRRASGRDDGARSGLRTTGERLDALLAGPLGSRARAQRLIDAGAVRVDGARGAEAPARRGRARRRGATTTPSREPRRARRRRAGDFAVAYEDEHLLVVDKPAGVVVHPARGHRTGTLAQALAGRAPAARRMARGIVHRLDRDTSGLLVVAQDRRGRTARCKARSGRREITREYLALVEGRPPARSGTIDAPIGRDRRVRTRHVDRHRRAARGASRTSRSSGAAGARRCCACAWRRAAPTRSASTCRRSAIRSCGDPEYGTAGLLGLERQFLHAARLAFAHPVTGAAVDVALAAAGRPARARWPSRRSGERLHRSGRTGRTTGGRGREADPHRSNAGRTQNLRTISYVLSSTPARPSASALPGIRSGSARARAGAVPHSTTREQPMAQVGIRELLEAGVHFGHQTRRWNPKMRRFIHGERGGIYIIDLLQTERAAARRAGVRLDARPPRRHRPVRRHEEAGPRRRQGRRPRRPACRTSTTAGSAAC